MPSDVMRNTPALACEVDARALAGAALFERAAVPYSLSISAARYWDVLALLHGYGSVAGADLGAMVQAAWTAAGALGNVVVGIDATDHFFIESDTEDFSVWGATVNAVFGFDTAGHGMVGGGAPWRRTAPNAWQRGVVAQPLLVLSTATVPAGFIVPSGPRRVQSLPVWLRVRGVTLDVDDVWAGLTVEDADIASDVRWLVRPDGRVEASWPTASGYSDPLWTSLDAMHALGFDGDEVSAADIALQVIVSTRPAASFLAPTRMLTALRSRVDAVDVVSRMEDGSHASTSQGPFYGWTLRTRVDGAVGSTEALEQHQRRWWTYARGGRPMTIYPMWGDLDATTRGAIETRRHQDASAARWVGGAPSAGGARTPYDLLYTVEADDRSTVNSRTGGRLLVVRSGQDAQARDTDYGGRDLDQYQEIVLRLDSDPSR